MTRSCVRNGSHRISDAALALFLGLTLLGTPGCALFSPSRRAKPATPVDAPAPPTTVPAAPTGGEGASSTAARKPPEHPKPPTPTPASGGSTSSSGAGAGPAATGAPTTPPAPSAPAASPAQTAPSTLSVDLPPEERARLLEIARRDRADADSLLKSIGGDGLSQQDQEKLRTIEGMMQASTEAEDRGDVQAASVLAHKARLLAMEMTSR